MQLASQVHPCAVHVQLEGWQVLGTGSGWQKNPAGQAIVVQLTGLGAPLQVPSAQATHVLPFVPQSAVHTHPDPVQLQLEGWHFMSS